MNNDILYNQSILLIGPSGAGKSTVADELCKITGMSRLCLDSIANRDRRNGFMKRFRNSDEYNLYMISSQIDSAIESGIPGIVDFGAGHSVYDDPQIFDQVKDLLKNFKNIVLLLPSDDIKKSLKILSERSTGDYSSNRKFIESSCNEELATMVIYENGRTPDQIAKNIIEDTKILSDVKKK